MDDQALANAALENFRGVGLAWMELYDLSLYLKQNPGQLAILRTLKPKK